MPPVLTRQPRRISDGTPPVGPASPAGHGGRDRWSLLVVAPNQVVAHLIEGCLAQEGIGVYLDVSNLSPGAWLYPGGDPASPVRVYVRRDDFAAASLILHDVETSADREPTGAYGDAEVGAVGEVDVEGWPAKATAVGVVPPPVGLSLWTRRVVYVVLGLMALATVSSLVLFGPCYSHWFCV